MNKGVFNTRPRGRLARFMVAASARGNYEFARHRPGRAPFIVLTEFPRSGGNWIRDMLGDALQLPVPRFSRLPVTFRAIIHNHDHRVIDGHDIVYVLRDGRDVFLSHFDKTVTTYLEGSPSVRKRVLGLHPSLALLARGAARDDVDLSMFYHEWMTRPLGSWVNCGAHVLPWISTTRAQVTTLRYEDMKTAPEATLARATATLSTRPVSRETIAFAVARNSFEAQTGRKPGEKCLDSTKRQGLAGAWKTQMPPDLQARFHSDFGHVLKAAGYES
ncbi:MAG: sulfotransferase domain-containing protein [Rhodobacteraceae bacterium]|nr:sulfotransferase domain-containing protein [Paracoccaceae bacterium]